MTKIIATNAIDYKSYITDPELHKIHKAKNPAFSFRPSDDIWKLDVHSKDEIDMSWLHAFEVTLENEHLKQSILRILVDYAEYCSPSTVLNRVNALKNHGLPSCLSSFKQKWPTMGHSIQKVYSSIFSRGQKLGMDEYVELTSFIDDAGIKEHEGNPLDLRKGAYSNVEEDSLLYALRIATEKILAALEINKSNGAKLPDCVYELGILISLHLMRGILRRPCQLIALKWDDIRPAGMRFSQDISSPELAEDGILHLRTFKGKRGTFRGHAEPRSHRLESELSSLIGIYHKYYIELFKANLEKQDISLSTEELNHFRKRAPIFVDFKVLLGEFTDKSTVLKSVSMKSKSFHLKEAKILKDHLERFTKTNLLSYLKSDRIPAEQLKFGNNRIRHTALTKGAINGMSALQLAAMTGVTPDAVKYYVDLSNEARARIDDALGDNRILNDFGRISIVQMQSNSDFVVKTEFDEEIGVLKSPHDCSRCKAKGGKPLGCYPCSNFKPFAEADHGFYLERAERRLKINKINEANEAVLKRYRKIIAYIKATINACQEASNTKLGRQ